MSTDINGALAGCRHQLSARQSERSKTMFLPSRNVHGSLARQVSVRLQKHAYVMELSPKGNNSFCLEGWLGRGQTRGRVRSEALTEEPLSELRLGEYLGISRSISGKQGGKERYFKWRHGMCKGRRYETAVWYVERRTSLGVHITRT